jgi:hypothetical protein
MIAYSDLFLMPRSLLIELCQRPWSRAIVSLMSAALPAYYCSMVTKTFPVVLMKYAGQIATR